MLNLPNIQAGATPVLPQNGIPATLPRQNGAGGDPFDQIMRQVLSSTGADQKSGSANLSQPNQTGMGLGPDFFNGAKYSTPLPPANQPSQSLKRPSSPSSPLIQENPHHWWL